MSASAGGVGSCVSVLLIDGDETGSPGVGAGTVGAGGVIDATAAAAAAAYRIGGSGAGFGAGAVSTGLLGNLASEGEAVMGLTSMVDFRKICFLTATGLGGCSSGGGMDCDADRLAGVVFFSFSSFAGVFGAACAGTAVGDMAGAVTGAGGGAGAEDVSTLVSAIDAESTLDKSSFWTRSCT